MTTEPQAGSPPAAEPTAVPLNQVMLAMDVVDTLRHQRAVVEAELDEEQRESELIDRIKAIYDSQGIEVPDEVIAEGVQALKQDRFTYKPPERTIKVRLAEVYVERGTWFKRLAIVGLLVALVWGSIAWYRSSRDRSSIEAFEDRITTVTRKAQTAEDDWSRLRTAVGAARETAQPSATTVMILADAEERLDAAGVRLAELRDNSESDPLDSDDYPSRQRELDAALETRRQQLAMVAADLGAASGYLQAVERINSLRSEVDRVLGRAEGVTLTDDDRNRVQSLRSRIEEALNAGDETRARRQLDELAGLLSSVLRAQEQRRDISSDLERLTSMVAGLKAEPDANRQLQDLRTRAESALAAGEMGRARSHLLSMEDLIDRLERNYELRIVSQPDEQSGVWRYPAGRRDVRNFYIIVEAIGEAGRLVKLSVTSEEDQSMHTVSRFGIRVPERVYEAVKADKLDNGIVDQTRFGEKRRGALEPTYRFEVLGGRITEWR